MSNFDVTISGRGMTITRDDGASFGPFLLPDDSFRWRGDWCAGTRYRILDLFKVGSGIFRVLQDHESASEFDPDTGNEIGPVVCEMMTIDIGRH